MNDNKNPKLEEYVLILQDKEVKFANADNQYILNYNE